MPLCEGCVLSVRFVRTSYHLSGLSTSSAFCRYSNALCTCTPRLWSAPLSGGLACCITGQATDLDHRSMLHSQGQTSLARAVVLFLLLTLDCCCRSRCSSVVNIHEGLHGSSQHLRACSISQLDRHEGKSEHDTTEQANIVQTC